MFRDQDSDLKEMNFGVALTMFSESQNLLLLLLPMIIQIPLCSVKGRSIATVRIINSSDSVAPSCFEKSLSLGQKHLLSFVSVVSV